MALASCLRCDVMELGTRPLSFASRAFWTKGRPAAIEVVPRAATMAADGDGRSAASLAGSRLLRMAMPRVVALAARAAARECRAACCNRSFAAAWREFLPQRRGLAPGAQVRRTARFRQRRNSGRKRLDLDHLLAPVGVATMPRILVRNDYVVCAACNAAAECGGRRAASKPRVASSP